MANYLFETATPAPDGANKVFSITQDYQPSGIAVYSNGVLGEKAGLRGWFEPVGGPAAGVFEMNFAPSEGDLLQVFFADGPFVPPAATPEEIEVFLEIDSLELAVDVELEPLDLMTELEIDSLALDVDVELEPLDLVAELEIDSLELAVEVELCTT